MEISGNIGVISAGSFGHILDQVITALSSAVEAKDLYTKGHSVRVASYAREIMRRMGGSEEEQIFICYIGLLHDVGKIRVPDHIINKAGRLTDEEYSQMKLHTVAGYHILREVTAIPDLAEGARWHHERYDGRGYPNGLSGDNIPLAARIISVADAYDAMTSNRSYRPAMPRERVRAEIERGAGSQFDPQIARVMLSMIDGDPEYALRQHPHAEHESILVIDDDRMTFRYVQKAFEDKGYKLVYASSAAEGLSLASEGYDLILLDLEMPGMNGFDVLEKIKTMDRKSRVILLTGDKSVDSIRRGESLGAVDYITKPILLPILRESISSALPEARGSY